MSIDKINKLAIIISWPREIDMFLPLIKSLPKNKLTIIANNSFSIENGRLKSNDLIIDYLKKNKLPYELFSDVYKIKKFKILLSTGEINGKKISFYSLIRFFYAFTFGFIIEKTKLSSIFEYLIGKPLTGDGFSAKLGLPWFPEKMLGEIVAKYPDNADIKKKNYPYNFFKNIFDIFFSFADFEISLIKKKFKSSECRKIFNPRFLNLSKNKNFFKEFKKPFFDKNKKTICWLPTYIDTFDDTDINIKLWFNKLSFLIKNFNLIIRPHPKTFLNNKNLIEELKKLNFIIDLNQNRKIGDLINNSDLILCDYGGSVFDALYLKKPIIFLNLQKKSKFEFNQIKIESTDVDIKKKLLSLNVNEANKAIKENILIGLKPEYKKKILKLNKSYFGNTKPYNVKQLSDYLLSFL